jgi:hypothetical protein
MKRELGAEDALKVGQAGESSFKSALSKLSS